MPVLGDGGEPERSPGAVVRGSAYMWGDGLLARALITASFSGIVAINWGMGLVLIFGTRPPAS